MDSFSDGCVHQVFNLSSCEARRHLSQNFRDDAVVLCNLVQVELEDVRSPVDVGVWHVNLLVKTTWSDSSRVES